MVGIFDVSQILVAPFCSTIKNKIGAKNTILFGFFLHGLSIIGFALMGYLQDPFVYKNAGLSMRFMQGIGDILFQVTAYGVICSNFSDNLEKYIRYIEISAGLGLSIGPFVGSPLQSRLGFQTAMYGFGSLNLLAFIIAYIMLPSELNEVVSEKEELEIEII